MKKITGTSLFIILLLAGSVAAKRQAAPRFEDYPATVYKGRIAPVNLNSAKGARMYRTNLREGAKEGVNFAGHYALVEWGCGAGCGDAGIVDVKTGRVHFPMELRGFGVGYSSDDPYEEILEYKPNSRLLILAGFPATEGNNINPKRGLYYYEWTGTRLRLIKYMTKKSE